MSGRATVLGYGRNQVNPVRGQVRREHGHRDHEAAQAADLRVDGHHLAVRHDVGAADLDGLPRAFRHRRRGNQVVEDVADRDWLDTRVHPSRAHHDRHPLGEVAHHLERQAARADDHRGAQLRNGHTGRAKRVAGLLPGPEVRREVVPGLSEATKVDDSLAAGRCERRRRRCGRPGGRAGGSPRRPRGCERDSRPSPPRRGRREASRCRTRRRGATSTCPSQGRPCRRAGSRTRHRTRNPAASRRGTSRPPM